MGNAESGNPVRNMDKRTARREYKDDFAAAITRYRQRMGYSLGNQAVKSPSGSEWADDGHVKVFVRKRPIFQHEIDNSEFDVASCFANRIVIHDARMHNDMKRQLMNHHEFTFDRVFHEKTTNDVVYQQAALPLVQIAVDGGYSTALVYGQTGSGKTFTMTSIYHNAAKDIFNLLHEHSDRFATLPVVTVSFVEIAGDNVSDLLNAFKPTHLTTGSDGSVHPYPVVEPVVNSSEELLAVIQHGLNIRTTAATGVHDTSSRSHALLRIYITRFDRNDSTAGVEGTLTLVDLAGSEHRIDSMYHGKERRKETSYINASLMALKDCIRMRASQVSAAIASAEDKEGLAKATAMNLQTNGHIYRKSKLTMALKNSFVLPQARTIVIATVSPASKDTEHSLNTLRHACIMHGQESDGQETRFVTGGTVTTEQIGEINISAISRRNLALKKQTGSVEGPKTSNGNTLDNRVSKVANQEVELTEKMKLKMRRMSEQKSFAALAPAIKEIFKTYRQRLGREQRQFTRLQINRVDEFLEEAMRKVREEEEALEQRAAREQEPNQHHHQGDNDDDEVLDEVQQFHSSLKDEEIAEDLDIMPSSPARHNNAQQRLLTHSRSSPNIPNTQTQTQQTQSAQQSTAGHTPSKRPPSASNTRNTNNTQQQQGGGGQGGASVSVDALWVALCVAEDDVPAKVLIKQFRALLRVHGYHEHDIMRLVEQKSATSSAHTSAHTSVVTPRNGSVSSASMALELPRPNSSSGRHSRSSTPTPHSARSTGTTSTAANNAANAYGSGYGNGGGSGGAVTTVMSTGAVRRQSSAPVAAATAISATVVQAAAVVNKPRPATPTQRRPLTPSSSSAAAAAAEDASLQRAKQQVADAAEHKRQRNEAARVYREEQERLKVDKVTQKQQHRSSSSGHSGNNKASVRTVEVAANDAERAEHLSEIARLTSLLEDDHLPTLSPEARLSAAKKFGIKKQLSLHKAAILKLERAKLALQQGTVPGGGTTSAVGAGHIRASNALSNDIDSMPAQSRSQAQAVQSQAQYESYNTPMEQQPLPMRSQSSGISQSKSSNSSKRKSGAFEYDPRDWETESDVVPTAPAVSQSVEPEAAFSAHGRPLSTRMQQQVQQRRQSSGSGSGSGAVVGFHVEERSSYDSDALSKALQQPVGLRSAGENMQYQQPPAKRNIMSYSEFIEEREDVVPSRSKQQPAQVQHQRSNSTTSAPATVYPKHDWEDMPIKPARR